MTEQEWMDLMSCIHAADNSDNRSTWEAAGRAYEWLMQQEWDD